MPPLYTNKVQHIIYRYQRIKKGLKVAKINAVENLEPLLALKPPKPQGKGKKC
jgi:hypothetical protein